MGTLAAYRKVAPVAQATVASQVHKVLDVHLHLAAQVALNIQVGVNEFPDSEHIGVREVIDPASLVHTNRFADPACGSMAYSMYIGQRDRYAL